MNLPKRTNNFSMEDPPRFLGYLRQDGGKGIRNLIVVAYLVECAHHVAREISFPCRDHGVQLIGFGGCYPNSYAFRMMKQLCTHPNVGGVLLVSLGCESFNRVELESLIRQSGRPVETLVIQQSGGTRPSISRGRQWVEIMLEQIRQTPRVEMGVEDLVVGTICGGSDATSGITANPAVGQTFDWLVSRNSRVIFEETGELIGCEQLMAKRAARPELASALVSSVEKAARHYAAMGHPSFAAGNAEGGLTTQEEKSMGAYQKSGSVPISGILKPGDVPRQKGLYLLDVVPDGEIPFGFANINDNAEIAELIACGSHLILFTTGRGSVAGSAISPVIKICANPMTYQNMNEDMDVNAGCILEGTATLEEVSRDINLSLLQTAMGQPTASEKLGHQEFVLTYKSVKPSRPGCPVSG
jgi:altronate dehydratase large subunit